MHVVKKTGYIICSETQPSNSNNNSQYNFTEADEELIRLRHKYLKLADDGAKKEDINALQKLFGEISHKYTSGLMLDERLPYTMRSVFYGDMRSFDRTMPENLFAVIVNAFDNEREPKKTMEHILPKFRREAGRLSNLLWRHDHDFRGYLALTGQTEHTRYLFLSDEIEPTCERCSKNHGKVLTDEELSKESVIPPLHPNCGCCLVAMDSLAERVYNLDRDGFIAAVERALGESGGGIFLLDPGFVHLGVSPLTLTRLELPETPEITDPNHPEPKWYEGIKDWAAKFGEDALAFIEAIFLRAENQLAYANEVGNENEILGLLLIADAFFFGIVSGIWEGLVGRATRLRDEPSAYNLLNNFSLGIFDLVGDIVKPDEPWSFEHFLNMLGLGTLIYSVYQWKNAGVIDDAAGAVDDVVDDAARAGAGLRQSTIDDILGTPKGQRPDPSTYLSKSYIDGHLANFKDGVTKFYANAPSGAAGPSGGTFVMPSSVADDLIKQANGSVLELEKLLGLDPGDLGNSPVRIDIPNPTGLRLPSGNERGVNSQWIPGGYTSGGIKEAIIDSPNIDEYIVNSIDW